MGNLRRTVWTTVIFIGLLAPFAIVLALSLEMKAPPRAVLAAQQGGAGTQDAPTLQTMLIAPPPSVAAATSQDAPLLASGDGKTLWVVHPAIVGEKGQETRAYELLARSSNSGTWSQAQSDRGQYFGGFPRGLAAIAEGASKSEAYVFTEGFITRFSLSEHALVNRPLGKDQALLAETGGVGEMFAVTLGPKPEATTQPAEVGDALPPPGAWNVPTTAASTQATTAATQPAGPPVVNLWWYHDDDWVSLPAMGDDGPGSKGSITMVAVGGRLVVCWAEGGASHLNTRGIAYKQAGAAWGPRVTTEVEGGLPTDLRLLSAVLDDSAYVMWPTFTGRTLFLRGGALVTKAGAGGDLTLPAQGLLPPLNLGAAVAGPLHVAIGAAENSLAVVVEGEKGALSAGTFTSQGAPLTKMSPVEVKARAHDQLIVQYTALLVLVLLVFLSLWQWRQRQGAVKLPAGMVTASLPTRGLACGIDLFIALMVVSAVVGVSDYAGVITAWADSVTNPERLTNSPAALYTLGVYLLHVTVGELFFGRSIGKALLGMQVVMADGKPPTVGAVLLRNLVRLPEMLSGILVINVVLSESKQRLGDAMARTVVVSQESPAVPEDPDKEGDEGSGVRGQGSGEEEAVSGKKERLR